MYKTGSKQHQREFPTQSQRKQEDECDEASGATPCFAAGVGSFPGSLRLVFRSRAVRDKDESEERIAVVWRGSFCCVVV